MLNQYFQNTVKLNFALVLCLFTWSAPCAFANSASDQRELLVYDQHHSMLSLSPKKPLLRVFASGLVEVHRPAYMKGAGGFQMQLTDTELSQLKSRLQNLNLKDFDAKQVRQQIRQLDRRSIDQTSHTLHAWSDDTHTTMALNFLDRANSDKRGPVRWSNIGGDASRYTQVQALQNLAAAEQVLMQLVWHVKLQALASPGSTAGLGEQ